MSEEGVGRRTRAKAEMTPRKSVVTGRATRQLLKASPGRRAVVAQATQNAGRSAGPSSSSGSEEEDFQSEGDHTVESSSEEIEAEACDDGSDDSHGTEEPLTSKEVGSDAGVAGEHSQEHMIR